MMFNDRMDRKLIALVQDHPVLYDFNHIKYMDFNAREVAWQKIGDELKRPAADCKIRWINIRDVHRRMLKKQMKTSVKYIRPYKYENELVFMRPFYKDVVPIIHEDCETEDRAYEESWIEENEGSNDSDDSAKKPQRKRAKTRKNAKKRKEVELEEDRPPSTSFQNEVALCQPDLECSDPVDAFLISIAATLKTFSPYHLNVAKSKIFAVVQEHDLEQIVQKEHNDGSPDVKVSTSEAIQYLH